MATNSETNEDARVGNGWRWHGSSGVGSKTAMAPSVKAVEDGVVACLGEEGLRWLATTSECSSPKVVTGTHALLRGVAADEKPAHSMLFAGPPLMRNGEFVPARTERQRPLHADSCPPNSHAHTRGARGDAHLSVLVALQDKTLLHVCPFDRNGLEEEVWLKKHELLVFRGDLLHAGAAYNECNISVHCYVDSPCSDRMRVKNDTFPSVTDAWPIDKFVWPVL